MEKHQVEERFKYEIYVETIVLNPASSLLNSDPQQVYIRVEKKRNIDSEEAAILQSKTGYQILQQT